MLLRDNLEEPVVHALPVSYDRRPLPRNNQTSPHEKAPAAPPSRSPVEQVLAGCGISGRSYRAALDAAHRNDTDAASELIASGHVSRAGLTEAMADILDLRFEAPACADRIVTALDRGSRYAQLHLVRTCDAALRTKTFLLPRLETLDTAAQFLARRPDLKNDMRVTTPRAMAAHDAAATSERRAADARRGLSNDRLDQSARVVVTGSQGLAAGFILAAGLFGLAVAPHIAAGLLHLVMSLLFSGCVMLRLMAAFQAIVPRSDREKLSTSLMHRGAHPLPLYSVLVALRDEADVVPKLVAALDRLQWPRTRLEIMLICEADDPATIAAVRREIADLDHVDLILVPPSLPRTKPKALNYALPLTNGEFLVLFDAEDDPHPHQLADAYEAFRQDGDLACLQAPLLIRNGDAHWLAGLFALEYAALFRGLLPWLARHALPLPLGGTSNHFRREKLIEVGGWDSHNVTEDADLGMRLCRSGCRIGVIGTPTLEDAPVSFRVWRNQRTRWLKGWMQTLLVHTRQPVRLYRELGPLRFLVFHFLFLGMIASAFAHPFLLLFVGWTVWTFASASAVSPAALALLALDLFNLVGGLMAFVVLARTAIDEDEREGFGRRLLWLYPYWFLTGVAALRAFGQLFADPFKWEKTPHGLDARMAAMQVHTRRDPIWDVI